MENRQWKMDKNSRKNMENGQLKKAVQWENRETWPK